MREFFVLQSSRLPSSWFTDLVWRGWRRPLILADIPETDPSVQVAVNAASFQHAADQELERHGRLSLWRILLRPTFFGRYLAGLVLMCGESVLIYVSPLLLRLIILFMKDGEEPAWRGYLYAALMFLREGESSTGILCDRVNWASCCHQVLPKFNVSLNIDEYN